MSTGAAGAELRTPAGAEPCTAGGAEGVEALKVRKSTQRGAEFCVCGSAHSQAPNSTERQIDLISCNAIDVWLSD